MMKIAVFASKFPLISETFVINQIVGLLKEGVDVDIITNETPDYTLMHSAVEDYSLNEKLTVIGLDTRKNKTSRIKDTLYNCIKVVVKGELSSLTKIVFDKHLKMSQKMNLISAITTINSNERKYDNIICHFGVNGYYVCKLRELGLISGPVSTVFHGYEVSHHNVTRDFKGQYFELFKVGDMMLPISDLWASKLESWGCNRNKIKVHRMGIDVDDFELRDVSKSLASPLKVLQVGRLTEKKAILNSIKAVALASQSSKIDFTVIGDGELYQQAKQLVRSLDAESFIHLIGQQPQSQVKKYLEESDVFLLPSVRAESGDMEGIPVSLMEAMAKGLIAVSTVHSGIPELIENEVSGFLVPEHDIEALAHTLAAIPSLSEKEIESIRRSARMTCEQKFNNCKLNSDLRYII
ncbi:glycosyltransferase [Vibrio cincinnatiensis]|uniref:glycosyltransferase n=1 Tax=Vibrio cincinnatiensis TaxID=675 RepID=UPI001EDCEAAD|nr:glycosyltransferase [Vibrio cincinnatiensis]MCG3744037.1 glycosyltransferase [Vibrio cincinnatiensis]